MINHQIPKKEKGTYKSTPDSVKNQVQYTKKGSIYKENSIILIDRLISTISRDQAYLIDENQIMQFDSYIRFIQQIRQSVLIDPRYPHQIAQKIMDNMFSRDNQITGASVDFDFCQLKNNLENYVPHVRPLFKNTK